MATRSTRIQNNTPPDGFRQAALKIKEGSSPGSRLSHPSPVTIGRSNPRDFFVGPAGSNRATDDRISTAGSRDQTPGADVPHFAFSSRPEPVYPYDRSVPYLSPLTRVRQGRFGKQVVST